MNVRTFAAIMVLGVGVLAGAALARHLEPEVDAAALVPQAGLAALQDSFAATSERAMKSVVHINTRGQALSFTFAVPQGIGSGVIVSADGHILTNYHVVRGARSLKVLFSNGKEVAARVIGKDEESDLALLKIDPPEGMNLVPIPLADSDKTRVGDWVLAIGSPFGYNHTVTVGIVSAKHRRASLELPYQDFIQTDAAINPGNSGGALVNIRGELVGINTAIISSSRGHDGVGFAIASNLVKWVYKGLAKEGRVRRGYLGVASHDLDEELVAAFRSSDIRTVADLLKDLGMENADGCFLVFVEDDTPADRAGLRRGDVIVEFNGHKIKTRNDLFFRVAEAEPGAKVAVKFVRDGEKKTAEVELAERPR